VDMLCWSSLFVDRSTKKPEEGGQSSPRRPGHPNMETDVPEKGFSKKNQKNRVMSQGKIRNTNRKVSRNEKTKSTPYRPGTIGG